MENQMRLPAFDEVRTWAGASEQRRLCEQGDVNRGTTGWAWEGEDSGISPAKARGKGRENQKE